MSNKFSTRGNLVGPGGSERVCLDLNLLNKVKRPNKRAPAVTAMGSEKAVGSEIDVGSERSERAVGSDRVI